MRSPKLTDADGRAALTSGLDTMVQAHREAPPHPEELEPQRLILQRLFSPDEIASLFIIAVNRLAGHDI